MSAGDTESTGCEKVSVRKTRGSPEADALLSMPISGACSHPVGLRAQCTFTAYDNVLPHGSSAVHTTASATCVAS